MHEFEEKTLLVIDADPAIHQEIQTALPDRPCRYVFIDKAADAVVSLMVEAPNLVVLCMEMPDGDGISLLGNVRAMDQRIPIIIIIGEPTKEKVLAAKKAMPLDILLKPPNWERLASKVKNALWIDPELLRGKEEKKEGEEGEEGEEAPPKPEEPKEKPFREAVPKGAEVLNINDTITGMKVARTLVFNDVVYADKGQLLTDHMITQLNRMGVPEICVYIDQGLKRKVKERKDRAMKQQSMAAQKTAPGGGQVFSKVKRQAIRVDTDIIGSIVTQDEEGKYYEEDCNIVDISAGGCALLTKSRLKKDQSVILSFELAGMEMKNVRGIVRHCMARNAKPPDFPIRSGIFFDAITERDKERLFNKVFEIERDNKRKEDEMRARFGYGPKRRRKR